MWLFLALFIAICAVILLYRNARRNEDYLTDKPFPYVKRQLIGYDMFRMLFKKITGFDLIIELYNAFPNSKYVTDFIFENW
jgi:hypothetical protein